MSRSALLCPTFRRGAPYGRNDDEVGRGSPEGLAEDEVKLPGANLVHLRIARTECLQRTACLRKVILELVNRFVGRSALRHRDECIANAGVESLIERSGSSRRSWFISVQLPLRGCEVDERVCRLRLRLGARCI